MRDGTDIRDHVRERYAEAAKQVATGRASCCGPSPLSACDPITKNLYSEGETGELPEAAVLASLGCGNPTALAELRPGEVVLDLGSGGGIDVILSARRVGPTGKAYGLDMTDEMLALARENQKKAGVENVEFLKGAIEEIPLPDASVDVIISNCVINLSGDKDRVLREAFRVLKPGGRFAVSDVVLRRELPEVLQRSLELWAGCVAGALTELAYGEKLAAAGFGSIDVEVTREYRIEEFRDMLTEAGIADQMEALRGYDGAMVSAFVRATKPAAAKVESVWTDAVSALVGVGAAIGSNCGPCFEHHAKRARSLGVSDADLRRAVAIARKVKEAPARAVLELAEKTLAGDTVENGASAACCPPSDEPVAARKDGTATRCC